MDPPAVLMPFSLLITLEMEGFLQLCQRGMSYGCVLCLVSTDMETVDRQGSFSRDDVANDSKGLGVHLLAAGQEEDRDSLHPAWQQPGHAAGLSRLTRRGHRQCYF